MDSVRWTEKDRFGNMIQMSEERWRHVCVEHSDLARNEDWVRLTVREPQIVYQDTVDNTFYYFRRVHLPGHKPKFTKAVIGIAKSHQLFVVTAHSDKKIRVPKGARLTCINL